LVGALISARGYVALLQRAASGQGAVDVAELQRNVKTLVLREMGLQWTAAGMLEAEKQFRKVIGYTDLPRRAVAIE
jgi:hypothetical protein